ncbi:MAG: ABC-type uncharacterized transport system permease subunit [Paracoccaceae bacterium]|jgi:ABC-type uncharacterized transport system permease subunit
MDLSAINPLALIATLIVASTPILFAALGELVVEKTGVLNLGVEGMMITGAICGFAVAVETGNPWIGFLAAAAGGAFLALIFAVLTQYFLSNQVATGLALTLFGLGFSALMGISYVGIKPPPFPRLEIQFLNDLPFVGQALLSHDYMVYVSLLLVAAAWYFLKFTRAGLVLRAVGENHDAAHAIGYNVKRIRVMAILFGGACAGLGGGYLSLIRTPLWTEGMTAGAGWIALALVVFASWKPGRVMLGAYLFGGVSILQLNLQAVGASLFQVLPAAFLLSGIAFLLIVALSGFLARRMQWRFAFLGFFGFAAAALVSFAAKEVFGISDAYDLLILSSSPYLVTILVLVIMSGGRSSAPASLGRVFHASH